MQTPRARASLSVPILAACALSVATAGTLSAQDGSAPALSYRISAEAQGTSWGEWLVAQGEDLAVARRADSEGSTGPGEVALVAGPAVGGLPSEPWDQGLLAGLFDPAAGFGPGFWKASPYRSGTAVVDSLRIELREGDTNEAIDGRDARHHVLTARLWWRHVADDGAETAVFETGTADLWFAPDLPFSWLPFAVHPANPGLAFPLANSWPEVAWAAIAEHGDRLEALGLLLRARTRDEIHPSENPEASSQLVGIEYERSVSVSEVATDAETADAEAADAGPYRELPRVPRSRAAVLQMALSLLDPCRSLESAEAGSSQFLASSPQAEYLGGGPGTLFLTDAGIEDGYVVVTGGVQDGSGTCTLIVVPGADPQPGTFPVAAPDPGLARLAPAGALRSDVGDSAVGVYLWFDQPHITAVLVLDGGQVRIDEAGPAGVSGKLEGDAWGLALHPAYPRVLHEGFEVTLTFEAVPGSGGP